MWPTTNAEAATVANSPLKLTVASAVASSAELAERIAFYVRPVPGVGIIDEGKVDGVDDLMPVSVAQLPVANESTEPDAGDGGDQDAELDAN